MHSSHWSCQLPREFGRLSHGDEPFCAHASHLATPVLAGGIPLLLYGHVCLAVRDRAELCRLSFTLGWLAEHTSLQIAFVLLGLLYGTAVLAALRTTGLERSQAKQSIAD